MPKVLGGTCCRNPIFRGRGSLYKPNKETMKFPKGIRKKLAGKSGLYFLYDNDDSLCYIGKSTNLSKRIVTSANTHGLFRVRYALIPNLADMNLAEAYYISKLKPPLNTEFVTHHELTFECIVNVEMSCPFEVERDPVVYSGVVGFDQYLADEIVQEEIALYERKYPMCDEFPWAQPVADIAFSSIMEYLKRYCE